MGSISILNFKTISLNLIERPIYLYMYQNDLVEIIFQYLAYPQIMLGDTKVPPHNNIHVMALRELNEKRRTANIEFFFLKSC